MHSHHSAIVGKADRPTAASTFQESRQLSLLTLPWLGTVSYVTVHHHTSRGSHWQRRRRKRNYKTFVWVLSQSQRSGSRTSVMNKLEMRVPCVMDHPMFFCERWNIVRWWSVPLAMSWIKALDLVYFRPMHNFSSKSVSCNILCI